MDRILLRMRDGYKVRHVSRNQGYRLGYSQLHSARSHQVQPPGFAESSWHGVTWCGILGVACERVEVSKVVRMLLLSKAVDDCSHQRGDGRLAHMAGCEM